MSNKKIVIKKEGGGIYRIVHIACGILALMVSWFFNKSIGWAILHFLFSWIYLVYCLLTGKFANGGFMEIINYYF